MESASQQTSLPLREEMFEQCQAMARHALSSGLDVPATILKTLEALNDAGHEGDSAESGDRSAVSIDRLNTAHQRLAKIVAPATPRALTMLMEEEAKGGIFRFFGAVPLARQMMFVAMVFLVLLIALAMSEATSVIPGGANEWSIFEASGPSVLIRLVFLMSAAGLGACFAALFRVNRFVVNGTYDPKYAMSYWIRLLLGLISGLVLCELIPVGEDPTLQGVGKPTLALVGGFSANTLYRILERLVMSIESIVRGDNRYEAGAERRARESRAMEKAWEHRVALMARLVGLRLQLDKKGGVADAKQQLDAVLSELGREEPPPGAHTS